MGDWPHVCHVAFMVVMWFSCLPCGPHGLHVGLLVATMCHIDPHGRHALLDVYEVYKSLGDKRLQHPF